MNRLSSFVFLFTIIVFSQTSLALNLDEMTYDAKGVPVNDSAFPWHLVLDRGKILGCIYDNTFYSLGSILILESLPRKCELNSDRNGKWNQLSEPEMLLFKENIAAQDKLERESTYIGSDPITKEEAALIRYLRRVKIIHARQKNDN